MQFFIIFFGLILWSCITVEYSLATNESDLIRCTSQCSQITVKFAERTVFPPQCQENNYEYAFACGSEYRIDYDKEEITIDFQATNETESLENQKPGEFIFQTINLALSKNSNEPNVITRKYDCNTKDDCAKQAYLNVINYFIVDGPAGLELIRSKLHNDSLIIGLEARRRCADSSRPSTKPSMKCPTGLCYAELESYSLNDEPHYKQQRCDQEDRPVLFSKIEHHIPPSSNKEREFLKYRCNKNVCNRNDFIHKLQHLISEYTHGTLRIPGEKLMHGKSLANTIQQTISLVSFLCLIQLFI